MGLGCGRRSLSIWLLCDLAWLGAAILSSLSYPKKIIHCLCGRTSCCMLLMLVCWLHFKLVSFVVALRLKLQKICMLDLKRIWVRFITWSDWEEPTFVESSAKTPPVTRIELFCCASVVCIMFENMCWALAFRLDHLCIDQASRLNPLVISTYDDEDFVGKCKQLAIRCTANQLGLQALQRYSAFVCCRWLRRETEGGWTQIQILVCSWVVWSCLIYIWYIN